MTLQSGRADGSMAFTTAIVSTLKEFVQPRELSELRNQYWKKLLRLWGLTQRHWEKKLTAKQLSRRLVPRRVERRQTMVLALKQVQIRRLGLMVLCTLSSSSLPRSLAQVGKRIYIYPTVPEDSPFFRY
jgi:hypothetical protein